MAQPVSQVAYAEYLALEERSETKHEYVDGVIVAMAGGTPEHARLQMALALQLGVAARGKRCAVFSSDLRVRIEATNRATYPDVTVVCGALETSPVDKLAVTNPTVLVEVTSDGSEASDRGEKFAHYRRIGSLREYVIVAHRKPHVEVWRRNAGDRWELADESGPDGSVEIATVGARIDVAALYADPLAP